MCDTACAALFMPTWRTYLYASTSATTGAATPTKAPKRVEKEEEQPSFAKRAMQVVLGSPASWRKKEEAEEVVIAPIALFPEASKKRSRSRSCSPMPIVSTTLQEAPTTDYTKLTVERLKALCATRGVATAKTFRKANYVEALQAADAL